MYHATTTTFDVPALTVDVCSHAVWAYDTNFMKPIYGLQDRVVEVSPATIRQLDDVNARGLRDSCL